MKRLATVVIVLLVAAAAILVCRCNCTNKKPVCGSDKDLAKVSHQLKFKRTANGEVKAFVDGTCPAPCSGNSPSVNFFPINGLDSAGIGTCNPEHIRIDPGNAGKPVKCPNGSVQYSTTTGTLVIRNSAGATCAGADLVGATFIARTNTKHVELTIKEVVSITYGSLTREAYRIVATVPSSTPTISDMSVCDITRAGQVRGEIGLLPNNSTYSATLGSGSGAGSGSNWELAVALPGPLYSNTVKPLERTDGFFNLACADDSLAKLTLAQITVPTDGPTTQYAALRMMTGTFCDNLRTTRGMKIDHPRGLGSGSGIREAEWSAAY